MASNNPYHITTPYEVESQLAGYQKDVQDAELGKLRLEETKRVLSEDALARQIKADAIKGLETKQEQVVPQAPVGLNPQAPVQPQAVPGSTAFWQGQTSAAPEQVPQTTPVQQLQKSKTDFDLYGQQVQQYSTIAKALNDKGLTDQAEAYTAKAIAAKEKGAKAQEEYLTHTHKVLGYAGELADGYLDFVKAHPDDPAAQNAAWQRMTMTATQYGIPNADKLSQMPLEQREQYAEQTGNQAKTGAERVRLAIEANKEAGKAQRAVQKEAFDRDVLGAKNTHQAWLREFGEKKLGVQQDQFAYKALEGNLTKEISTVENRNKSLDSDINRYKTSLDNLQKGLDFYSASGKSITSKDPAIIEKEAGILNDALNAKMAEKQENADYIVQLNGKRRELTKFVPKNVKREGGAASITQTETSAAPSAAGSASYDTLSAQEKNWVDANAAYHTDMTQDEIIAEGIKAGKIATQKTSTTQPAAAAEEPSSERTLSKREQQLKDLETNKPVRSDFTDSPAGAGQFAKAITNWNKKYQALANPTFGQKISETYDDWFKTQTPDVIKDKNGDIISEEPGLEGSHPELLFIGGGKGAQVLVSKFGKPLVNSLGRLAPKFAEKFDTPEYIKVLEKVQARFNSSEGFNVLRGANYESNITVKELNKFTLRNLEKDAAAGNVWAKGIIQDAEKFISNRQATNEEIRHLILRKEAQKLKDAAFANGESAAAAEYESIENLAYKELKSIRAAQRRKANFTE